MILTKKVHHYISECKLKHLCVLNIGRRVSNNSTVSNV